MREDGWEVAWRGLLIGSIGYLIVFLGVGMGDALQGRSFFYTFSLLGGWLFYGLENPALVQVWPGAVFAYNGLHLLFFLAFGLFASWMASVAERGPLLWYAALVMYLFAFLHLFGAFLLMTEPIRSALSLWHVSIPSVLALAAMSWVLLRQHPQLRHELDEWVDGDDDELPASELRQNEAALPRKETIMFGNNESGVDRAARITLGLAILSLGWSGVVAGGLGTAFKILGFVPLLTGIVGWCPLYAIFGVSTNHGFHRTRTT